MTLVLREIANDTRQVYGEVICVQPVPWRVGDTIMAYVLNPVVIKVKSLQEFHCQFFDDPKLGSLGQHLIMRNQSYYPKLKESFQNSNME